MRTTVAWALALGCATVSAGQLTGTMRAKLHVNSGCQIADFASGTDLGRLDFGETGPLWSDYLTADGRIPTGGAVHIICSPDISGFLVSIDAGRHGDLSSRYLAKYDAAGRVVAKIPYNVYRDPARSVPYVPLLPQSFAIDGLHTEVALPLYGVINSSAGAVAAGHYEDLLGITVDW